MHNYKFVYLFLLIFSIVFSACEKNDDSVIDPTLSFPRILSASVTPNTFDTISVNGIITAIVTSDLPIANVTAIVKNPLNAVVGTVTLKDNGIAPDSAAGDGKFTGSMNVTLSCKLVGPYTIGIIAANNSGLSSNQFNVGFNLTNGTNHRPTLTFVISPDSLLLPSGANGDSVVLAFLQAWPNDPDGICDVGEVQFHSYRPDGTVTNNGNFISLFDDGDIPNHCDTIAGDGKFSLCIKLVNNPHQPGYIMPQIGPYTFKYYALDRAVPPLVSDTLTKTIVVHQ